MKIWKPHCIVYMCTDESSTLTTPKLQSLMLTNLNIVDVNLSGFLETRRSDGFFKSLVVWLCRAFNGFGKTLESVVKSIVWDDVMEISSSSSEETGSEFKEELHVCM